MCMLKVTVVLYAACGKTENKNAKTIKLFIIYWCQHLFGLRNMVYFNVAQVPKEKEIHILVLRSVCSSH